MFYLIVFLLCHHNAALHITSGGQSGDHAPETDLTGIDYYIGRESKPADPISWMPMMFEWNPKCLSALWPTKLDGEWVWPIATKEWKNTRKSLALTLARLGPVGAALVVAVKGAVHSGRMSEDFPSNLGPWLMLFDCTGFFMECLWDLGWACKDEYEESLDRAANPAPDKEEQSAVAKGKQCENQKRRARAKFWLGFLHFFTQFPNAINWVGQNIPWASSGAESSGSEKGWEPGFEPSDLKCFGYSTRLVFESIYDFPQGFIDDVMGARGFLMAQKKDAELSAGLSDVEKRMKAKFQSYKGKGNKAAYLIRVAKEETAQKTFGSNGLLRKKALQRFASGCFYFNIVLEIICNCKFFWSEEPDKDKDGEDVWPSHDSMQQTNLAAGIVYFMAITANLPNHFWSTATSCEIVCDDEGSKSHQLYLDLCTYEASDYTHAGTNLRACRHNCATRRNQLKKEGYWCGNIEDTCEEQKNVAVTKVQSVFRKVLAKKRLDAAEKARQLTRKESSDLVSDPAAQVAQPLPRTPSTNL